LIEDNAHLTIATLFESVRMQAALDTQSQSHLESCGLCRGRLSWMQTADLGPQECEYEPPDAVVDKVLQLGREASVLKQLGNFIVASLTFDSFGEAAAEGVRAEGSARQMTYRADDVDIALWLRRSEEGTMTLAGQITSKSSPRMQNNSDYVDLVVGGDHVRTSSFSPWGEFLFPDLMPSSYSLHISLADRMLRIPSIRVIDDERSQQ
jgi:hypothetical protein